MAGTPRVMGHDTVWHGTGGCLGGACRGLRSSVPRRLGPLHVRRHLPTVGGRGALMAAPGSPYSRVMCGPGDEPPFVWAWYAGAELAVIAVVPLVRRGLRPGLARVLVVLVLIIPVSVIGLLHVSLPRDCRTG